MAEQQDVVGMAAVRSYQGDCPIVRRRKMREQAHRLQELHGGGGERDGLQLSLMHVSTHESSRAEEAPPMAPTLAPGSGGHLPLPEMGALYSAETMKLSPGALDAFAKAQRELYNSEGTGTLRAPDS